MKVTNKKERDKFLFLFQVLADELEKSDKKKLVIYGAGKFTHRFLPIALSIKTRVNIVAIFDDNAIPNQKINNLPVISADKLSSYDHDAIFLSTDFHEDVFLQRVLSHLGNKANIYRYSDLMRHKKASTGLKNPELTLLQFAKNLSIQSILQKALKKTKQINPFKSQKGQDKWVLLSCLPLKRKGFFLDLAAADGITHSNTYVMEKVFGWSGICIEPNPAFLDKLKEIRTCTIDGSVISDKKEKVNFRIDNGQLGGIVAEDTDNSMRVRSKELLDAHIIVLDAVLLTDLLESYNAPKIIDYFSLDVEGSEERIIRSFDFEKFQFNCLSIERPTPKINEILFENGYVFVKNQHNDSFYVHSSLAKKRKLRCQPFVQVLPKNW